MSECNKNEKNGVEKQNIDKEKQKQNSCNIQREKNIFGKKLTWFPVVREDKTINVFKKRGEIEFNYQNHD